jgi:hypothetical protein
VILSMLVFSLLLQNASGEAVAPGAVTGHLATMDGIPAVAVRVVAVEVPRGNGRFGDGLNYFELAQPTDRTLTDNEGNYRLQEIKPGRYYILAGAPPNGTYYPGTDLLTDATIIDVEPGVEKTLDFRLLHRLGGKVSGRINASMAALGPRTATITGPPLEDLLEVAVKPDGTFEFGHLPPGNRYLVSLYPPTPGIASYPVTVGQTDVSGIELTPLPTKRVSGRITVRNGAIPYGILGFYTTKTYVSGKINPDGTFNVDLHSTQHQIDFAGLPIGYSVASVKVGDRDVTQQGIVVGNADVNDVVITLNAPKQLAVVKGRITGLSAERLGSTAVVLTGLTFNKIQADVEQTGTFQFDAVLPGTYTLSLMGVSEYTPIQLNIDSFRTFEVNVVVPNR